MTTHVALFKCLTGRWSGEAAISGVGYNLCSGHMNTIRPSNVSQTRSARTGRLRKFALWIAGLLILAYFAVSGYAAYAIAHPVPGRRKLRRQRME